MREYLDRSIDAWWEEEGLPIKDISGSEASIKAFVGSQYIQLRGICKQKGIWFEGAIGEAYNELQLKQGKD